MRPPAIFLILTLLTALFWIYSRPAPPIKQATVRKHTLVAAQFEDKSLFLTAIKQARGNPSIKTISGLTLPHHLLARDLIAEAFNFASEGKYRQIVVLSPDHFNLGETNISVAEENFSTAFGELSADSEAIKKLKFLPFVNEQSFFYREHGIQAVLPFVKYYFPETKVIALAFKETTPKSQLDQVANELENILATDSLIVQSTDFSHYLTPRQANLRDRQTLEVLERANPDELWTLNQPANLDSIAAQYLQSRLQNEFFKSKFHLLDHKNSQDYTDERVESSTSYIVQAYF